MKHVIILSLLLTSAQGAFAQNLQFKTVEICTGASGRSDDTVTLSTVNGAPASRGVLTISNRIFGESEIPSSFVVMPTKSELGTQAYVSIAKGISILFTFQDGQSGTGSLSWTDHFTYHLICNSVNNPSIEL